MTAAFVGLVTAALIVWAASVRRADQSRLPVRADFSGNRVERSPLRRIGQQLRRLPVLRKLFLASDDVSLGAAVLVGGMLFVLEPAIGVMAMAAIAFRPRLSRRLAAQKRTQAIETELPMMAELLRIAVNSGLNITMAIRSVSERVEGPLCDELKQALKEVDRGRGIADALDDVSLRAGDCTRPLIGGLLAAERYGSPLSSTLERLALESRADTSRRTERAAKRLTIYLLFPLAGCTLPAFALLSVAPLIASSIGSLAFFE